MLETWAKGFEERQNEKLENYVSSCKVGVNEIWHQYRQNGFFVCERLESRYLFKNITPFYMISGVLACLSVFLLIFMNWIPALITFAVAAFLLYLEIQNPTMIKLDNRTLIIKRTFNELRYD